MWIRCDNRHLLNSCYIRRFSISYASDARQYIDSASMHSINWPRKGYVLLAWIEEACCVGCYTHETEAQSVLTAIYEAIRQDRREFTISSSGQLAVIEEKD